MSILIGRIENKFWRNQEHKFPNSFPVYAEEKNLLNDDPNMSDFLSGTIYLNGDHWNHCLYNGNYYSLYIMQVISEERKLYLYRLERDLWFDVLTARPSVIGDLSNTNDDALIAKNLNRTRAVLDNPARIITINFGDVQFDGKSSVVVIESTDPIYQKVLDSRELDGFNEAKNSKHARNWKEIDKEFFSGIRNPAVFLLAELTPKYYSGGKELLRNKINEFIKSIPTSGTTLKIAKLAEVDQMGQLTGKYCITSKVDGISTSSENVRLSKVDLSGLTDIISITAVTLEEITPSTPLGKGSKSGLFDQVVQPEGYVIPKENFRMAKICRTIQVPIACSSSARTPNFFPEVLNERTNQYQFLYWRYTRDTWNVRTCPQRVDITYDGQKQYGHLWYVDNLNFICHDNDFGIDSYSKREKVIGGGFGVPAGGGAGGGIYGTGTVRIWYKPLTNEVWDLLGGPPIRPWVSGTLPFKELPNETIVPLGVKIFGLERREINFRLFEYTSSTTTRSLNYFSGISSSFMRRYGRPEQGYWWSKIDPDLEAIQPGSTAFARFYLENYFFNWAAFFRGKNISASFWSTMVAGFHHEPYTDENQRMGGVWKHTNRYGYVKEFIKSDVWDVDGNYVTENPFNKDRYPAHRHKVDANLYSHFLLNQIELPEGLVIEKGDYVFGDNEYTIRVWRDFTPDFYGLLQVPFPNVVPEHYYASILFDLGRGTNEILHAPPGQTRVFLCCNMSGELEVRSHVTFTRRLELSKSQNQIVDNVDQKTSETVTYTVMKKPKFTFENPEALGNEKERELVKLLVAFYEAYGYKVGQRGDTATWIWYEEDDFGPDGREQLLFDLVGTDWYCHIYKGRISLIAKDNRHFSTQTGKTSRLLHEENEGLNLSIIEKVNQKVRFQFLNAPYYLNWKTTFTSDDRISLNYETLKPTDKQTKFEEYFLSFDTGFDTAHYENISIPKPLDRAISLSDSVAMERLRLDVAHEQYAYQIDQDRYSLAQQRHDESIRRATVALEHQRIQSYITAGLSVSSTGFASLVGRRPASTVIRTKTNWQRTKRIAAADNEGQVYSIPNGAHYLRKTSRTITERGANYVGLLGAGALAASRLAANMVMDHAFRFPERDRQIAFQKQMGAADLALQSMSLETSHLDRQEHLQLEINRLSNKYDNPIINEREILDMFMNKSEWHGKKLKPAYLIVSIPSEEQLVALRDFKEEFGVMCDIPNVELHIYEGMPPDVVRYRNLDDDSISGIDNLIVRDFLKARLLAGLKIVEATRERRKHVRPHEYQDRIYLLESDLKTKEDTISRQAKEIATATEKIEGLTTELQSCQAEGIKLTSDLEKSKAEGAKLTADLQKCKGESVKLTEDLERTKAESKTLADDLEKCRADLVKVPLDYAAKLKALEETKRLLEAETHKHKTDLEEATQQLNDCRRRAINERDEINRLKAQLARQPSRPSQPSQPSRPSQPSQPSRPSQPSQPSTGGSNENCIFFIRMARHHFYLDPGESPDGSSKLFTLMLNLAMSCRGLRLAKIDQSLATCYEARILLSALEAMQDVPVIGRFMDVLADPRFTRWRSGKDLGGEPTQEQKNLDLEVSRLEKAFTNILVLNGLKVCLDAMNLEAVLLGNSMEGNEELKKNEDLHSLLVHFYPGQHILRSYAQLYGRDKAKEMFAKGMGGRMYPLQANIECKFEPNLGAKAFFDLWDQFIAYIDSATDRIGSFPKGVVSGEGLPLDPEKNLFEAPFDGFFNDKTEGTATIPTRLNVHARPTLRIHDYPNVIDYETYKSGRSKWVMGKAGAATAYVYEGDRSRSGEAFKFAVTGRLIKKKTWLETIIAVRKELGKRRDELILNPPMVQNFKANQTAIQHNFITLTASGFRVRAGEKVNGNSFSGLREEDTADFLKALTILQAVNYALVCLEGKANDAKTFGRLNCPLVNTGETASMPVIVPFGGVGAGYKATKYIEDGGIGDAATAGIQLDQIDDSKANPQTLATKIIATGKRMLFPTGVAYMGMLSDQTKPSEEQSKREIVTIPAAWFGFDGYHSLFSYCGRQVQRAREGNNEWEDPFEAPGQHELKSFLESLEDIARQTFKKVRPTSG